MDSRVCQVFTCLSAAVWLKFEVVYMRRSCGGCLAQRLVVGFGGSCGGVGELAVGST